MIMKRVVLLVTLFISVFATSSLGQTVPCVDGFAGNYPCHECDLVSHLSNSATGGSNSNDVWGWVSSSGHEFVLHCKFNGTAFIDISDPENPVFLGHLPTHTSNSTWRDVKIYDHYAFIVSEAGEHGMQVFDLNQLENVQNPPLTFVADAHYDGFGDAHNIVINESVPRAYGVGTNTASGGLHIVNISNPLNPTFMGTFAEDGYTHDAQVVTYNGPDADYTGKEVAFCSNADTFTIVDVDDPTDCQMVSSTSYDNPGYVHQGWLTEDHRYFLMGDEGDENSTGDNTRTIIIDCLDLDAPVIAGYWFGSTKAIDHNQYVVQNHNFQSNYRAGLRVLDISDVANGNMEEVAFFDVHPDSNSAGFSGSWSNYPYFPSGHIAVTSMAGGIFIIKPTALEGCTNPEAPNYSAVASIDDGSCLISGCPADFNGDLTVNTEDLLFFIAQFGCAQDCMGDLDADDSVNAQDLLIFLAAFGSDC